MDLNKQQRAAVAAREPAALVLAGAGTGKTRVIIERMAWLAEERGVDPRHLLALTFTNRAAGEMRERFAARLGRDRVAAWLGTFHGFGLSVLRRDMKALGRKNQFSILDTGDQMTLMKRLIKGLGAQFEAVAPREALSWISRLKQDVRKPDGQPRPGAEQTYYELWKRYHGALAQAEAVDFDDLLVLTVRLFEEHPDALERWRQRYRHILVDEYQDTNRAQYRIARLLSQTGEIFAVGDEDQSIYAWRGADINNILDFQKDFPEAGVYRLEENYRSTQPILDTANALVANNTERLGKTLFSPRKEGDPVRFFLAQDGADEANFIAEDIAKRGLSPTQVAVLFRTNAQTREVEEAFLRKGIHYRMVGGVSFYGRREIRDIMAYLRLLVNSADDEAMRRIINVPARGIGGTTLRRIEEYATLRRVPIMQVLREVEMDETLPARGRKSALELVALLDDLAMEAPMGSVMPLIETLLERTGYREHLKQNEERDYRDRLQNIEEFLSTAGAFDKREGGSLGDFLQELALLSAADSYQPGAPAATLLTCHSAKGLEFDHVYIAGLEEGLLPFGSDFLDDPMQNVEEERRLCYVAMTRARTTLTLSAAQSRMLFGRTRDRQVSRFVGEMGEQRLRVLNELAKPSRKQAPQQAAVQAEKLKTGTRVHHARFGPGTVMYTAGSGDKLKARIRFRTGRTAMLLVKAAPLEILEGK